MAGAEFLHDLGIILGPLGGIRDHQLHAGAGGLAFEYARQDLYRVRLAPLGGILVLTRFALVQPVLNHVLIDRNTRRAAIDGRTQRGPVALTPGGDAEDMAEAVDGHRDLSLPVPNRPGQGKGSSE